MNPFDPQVDSPRTLFGGLFLVGTFLEWLANLKTWSVRLWLAGLFRRSRSWSNIFYYHYLAAGSVGVFAGYLGGIYIGPLLVGLPLLKEPRAGMFVAAFLFDVIGRKFSDVINHPKDILLFLVDLLLKLKEFLSSEVIGGLLSKIFKLKWFITWLNNPIPLALRLLSGCSALF